MRGPRRPQDDQGCEEVRDLVQQPARNERVTDLAKSKVNENESHHGRRKRTR